jgi:drug/metabolite transporter (DMT)-like permease
VLLRDERLTPAKLVGIVVGLVGVALLVGFDPASIGQADFTAELALVGATISYAFAGVYARRFITGYRPMVPALFEVTTALVMIGVLAFIFEKPLAAPITFNSVVAVVWLGLLGSGLAFLVFFRLINNWGATRTSLVAYLMPVWGIVLGAAVLSEPVTKERVLGTVLVVGGIALVNVRLDQIAGALNALRGRGSPEAEATADAVTEQS